MWVLGQHLSPDPHAQSGFEPFYSLCCLPYQACGLVVKILPSLSSDPRKDGLVELILQVGVEQLTEQQKETLVRQLAVLLNVLDSDVKVLRIQAHTDVRYGAARPARGTQMSDMIATVSNKKVGMHSWHDKSYVLLC